MSAEVNVCCFFFYLFFWRDEIDIFIHGFPQSVIDFSAPGCWLWRSRADNVIEN